jgi:hypothetical protein
VLELSPVRASSDNYLWLIRSPEESHSAAVVDPAEARPVKATTKRHALDLRATVRVDQYRAVDRVVRRSQIQTRIDAVRELRQRDETARPTTIALGSWKDGFH